MFEGKHIHFSPVDKKPLCSYSTKLCKQRRINGYAFCIRHILEDKSAPFKQCAHVARYNKQKCTNPIPSNENREFCNSHMQVAGMLPKKERKAKKEKDKELFVPCDGKLKFADRLRALLKKENSISCNDDPFNSDDPYAFPDPISEQENGRIGYSATPILRTAWNCSQKLYDSVSDSQLRCDHASKNYPSFDAKVKSNTPKLSKTVNRLHAKIAQNKILDKQKKTQDSSQSTLPLTNCNFSSVCNIKTEPLSPIEPTRVSPEPTDLKSDIEVVKIEEVEIKLELQSEDSRNEEIICPSSTPQHISPPSDDESIRDTSCSSSPEHFDDSLLSDTSSEDTIQFDNIKVEVQNELFLDTDETPSVLQKMYTVFSNKKRADALLPLGFETSESEESDSEEEESNLYSHMSTFCVHNKPSTLQNKWNSRHLRKMRLKSELRQSYQQLCRLHTLHKREADHHRDLIQPLIDASRICPKQATELLMNHMNIYSIRRNEMLNDCEKKHCIYMKNERVCGKIALPYAKYCQKHIMSNLDQLLFQHCTAKYPDNTQCCVPVFDVCHELPLCDVHAKKRDNYQKMTLEPKPKKPRKKPKLSALIRPPKRGKKKKKPNPLRPASPAPPVQTHPPASSAILSSSIRKNISDHLSFKNDSAMKTVQIVLPTTDDAQILNGQINSKLGNDIDHFSQGAIDKSLQLPLDATELASQATKLLEEHDFTEVLNKIPDDAFNDLFVEARNGEYIPISNEELERALAAVSKDVHLANVSLAKLSSNTGPDLEELERSIDIHGSLLGAENLTSAIDENTFPELNNSLNVITSSFSSSDLNSFTQALSNIAGENIEQNNLPAVSGSHIIHNSIATVPLLTSDVTHPNVLNGHTSVAGLHPLNVDSNFSTHLLENGMNSAIHDGAAEGRPLSSSNLATILFGLGQASASVLPQSAFANGSNISEDAGLISTQGGLTSTHWLLNSSDQVLALSHMPYQNGFIVTSQGGTPYTNSSLLASVGKYPLQTISAEVSLVSSNTPLVTSSRSESVTCGSAEQAVPTINLASRPVSLQQNGSSTMIVQEGAS